MNLEERVHPFQSTGVSPAAERDDGKYLNGGGEFLVGVFGDSYTGVDTYASIVPNLLICYE